MQWLIDIVAEAVEAQLGIPPCFVDRGDPPASDFILGDFVLDGNPHDLDLSGIVPVGATGVSITLYVRTFNIGNLFVVWTEGNVNQFNASSIWTQVALIPYAVDMVIPVNPDRKITYAAVGGAWVNVLMTVKGWWK